MDNIEIQKGFFHPVCNSEEIERIFNIKNGKDYLLKLRGETLVDNMRLYRVYRNYALSDENNWSLEQSFTKKHYDNFLQHLKKTDYNKCKNITVGNIFSNDPNGQIFISDYGPIITISESLIYFFRFMNLALLNFDRKIPEHIRINSLRIAIRVMLQTESLDFLMDPRGIIPKDIEEQINNPIFNQFQFIAGHEYSHYILDHISEDNIRESFIFNAIFTDKSDYKTMKVYNQSQEQEFEADLQSIILPDYTEKKQLKIAEAALLFFASLDIYEAVIDTINPSNPHAYKSHPPARDRFLNILNNVPVVKKYDTTQYIELLESVDSYKEFLVNDVSLNIDSYEFYGSIYLDEPNTEWRGKELIDRVDYY